MKRRKGFTLVELLVVIAIIALLMGILMPALAKVRAIAYQLVCGTNLSGLGKAMRLYAGDYEEKYPITENAGSAVWDATNQSNARGGTITTCFYLLIKKYDVSPKNFVCRGDGAPIFEFTADGTGTDPSPVNFELEEAWDFGDTINGDTRPGKYCSYSMHHPFGKFAMGESSPPSAPLMADRNPWLDEKAFANLNDTTGVAKAAWVDDEYDDPDKRENSAAHGFTGQNVLYNDVHVSFEKRPNVGIQLDNIWKRWPSVAPVTEQQRQLDGKVPQDLWGGEPMDASDAYLKNDYQSDKWNSTPD